MPHLHQGAPGSFGAAALTMVIALTAFLYLRGWWQLRSTSSRVSGSRAFSFLVGLFLIWIAIASRLAALDHELLTVHMLKHVLLMTVAPRLIWLGDPVRALANGLPRRFVQRVFAPTFQLLPVQRTGSAIGQLAFCWLAAAAALVVWHIPAVFTVAMHSAGWHFVEQSSFLATGLLFWWPVVQPWPSVRRPDLSLILYLFFATLPCDILAGFLVFCDRVVYPVYSSPSPLLGFSILGDQQCAAAFMWTCVTIVYLIAGAVLTMRLLSPQCAYDAEPAAQLQGIPQILEAFQHGD
jgi:putative membrane protein